MKENIKKEKSFSQKKNNLTDWLKHSAMFFKFQVLQKQTIKNH